jgi:hypothetical protein
MRKRWGLLVLGAALLCAPISASAASEWASGATYGEKATGKLKYGVKNALLGWTSLFSTPYEATQAGDNVLVGIAQGLWNGVGQTVGGVAHAVTFPLPQIDIPLPEGGVSFGG